MLLAFARSFMTRGQGRHERLRLYGMDIDSRCVNMCRIQLRHKRAHGLGSAWRRIWQPSPELLVPSPAASAASAHLPPEKHSNTKVREVCCDHIRERQNQDAAWSRSAHDGRNRHQPYQGFARQFRASGRGRTLVWIMRDAEGNGPGFAEVCPRCIPRSLRTNRVLENVSFRNRRDPRSVTSGALRAACRNRARAAITPCAAGTSQHHEGDLVIRLKVLSDIALNLRWTATTPHHRLVWAET
jgi:hypothetical protein